MNQLAILNLKVIGCLLLLLVFTECKKNTQKSKPAVSSAQEVNQESNVLDFPKQFPLDSLLSFNSEEALIEIFGDHVTRSISSDNEGISEFPITFLFRNSENQVTFYWKDTLQMTCLKMVHIGCSTTTKATNWKTKEGITYGTTVQQLEEYNGKPFTFWGFEWDYGGLSSSWEGGRLEPRKMSVELCYSNAPEEVSGLFGDRKFYSNLPTVKKAHIYICGFSLRQ